MTNPAEQFMAASKANMQALEGAVNQAIVGAEKLVELNMTASKEAISESISHAKAAMAAKTPQELMSLQAEMLKPLADKTAAYLQSVQSMATEGSADMTKQMEAKMAEVQKAFGASVEQFVKSAPTGSESAMAAFQTALSNSQKAVESAQATFKQTTEAAQANFAAVVKKAGKAS
jgi:phasin family protein